MKQYEKTDLEAVKKDRENRAYYHNRYQSRFLVGTIAMVLVILMYGFPSFSRTEKLEPSQNDIVIAKTLTTIEGREAAIDEKYDGAKITRERTYGKDIISVFEVDDMYSFCVFEAIEDGYWMEYCGNLFPKTEMIKGTVYLGDNTHEYDVYLQGDTPYTRLLVTRIYKKYSKYTEKQNIHFDENGIGIAKNDFQSTRYYNPRIIAYDAEGNEYILDDGGIF